MIARHALFSFGASIFMCGDLAHTVVTYSAIEQHMASAVALVVLVFVLHFEITNYFKRLFLVATFIFVFCICCL